MSPLDKFEHHGQAIKVLPVLGSTPTLPVDRVAGMLAGTTQGQHAGAGLLDFSL